MSIDSSTPLAASMVSVTYAQKLDSITIGHDDSASSAIERIFAFVNGPTGKDSPQRQAKSEDR